MVRLIEVEPGKWRVEKPRLEPARSSLPMPMVISDTMDALEQVDGKFYTSKRAFRAVGRANGLVEVGNEKPKPRTTRPSQTRDAADARRASIKKAVEKFKAGHRA
jgi:hypothetical protein